MIISVKLINNVGKYYAKTFIFQIYFNNYVCNGYKVNLSCQYLVQQKQLYLQIN